MDFFASLSNLATLQIGLGLSMPIPWLPKIVLEEHPFRARKSAFLIGALKEPKPRGGRANRGGRAGNAREPRGPAVAVSSADNNPWPARICAMKWPHVRHFAAAGAGRVTRDVTVRKARIWPGLRSKLRVGAGFGPQDFGTALGHVK